MLRRGVPWVVLILLLRIPGLVLLVLAALGLLVGRWARPHLVVAAGLALYTGLWLYYSPQGRYYLAAFGLIERFPCFERRATAPARLRWEALEQGPVFLSLALYAVEPCYAALRR